MFEPSTIFSNKKHYEKPASTIVKMEQEPQPATVSKPQYFYNTSGATTGNADEAW